MLSNQYLNNTTQFPNDKINQPLGYDYEIDYEKINQLEPQSEQTVAKIQKANYNRQYKMYFTNIICLFVMCIFLYLIWRFTKHIQHYKILFGTGVFFIICYVFRNYLSLLLGAIMLIPLTVIDEVPVGCIKIENGNVNCISIN